MSIKNKLSAPSMGVSSICLEFLILWLKNGIIFLPITLIHQESLSAPSQSSAVNRQISRKIRRLYLFKRPGRKVKLIF